MTMKKKDAVKKEDMITEWIPENERINSQYGELTARGWCLFEAARIPWGYFVENELAEVAVIVNPATSLKKVGVIEDAQTLS